ncbi:lactonase family protein [Cellulomonas endophytica]|uniref:lactonase family protein n=1 Tax=Cellulomonas endophytica TaxID=2494735 RepID=UPI003B849957
MPLLVGTYPAAGAGAPAGRGEGVWRVDLDPADGSLHGPRLLLATPAPSFLRHDRAAGVVHAVGEASDGTVSALRVVPGPDGAGPEGAGPDGAGPGALEHLATVPSGGADPCHLVRVDVPGGGAALLVANYSSGSLAVLPLVADGPAAGTFATDGPTQVLAGTGTGPRADRQEAPHAHFVAPAPGGVVLVVDLGTDRLRRLRPTARDGRVHLVDEGVAATLPPGTGPRHLAVTPDGGHLLVVGELDGRLHVLAWDAATATASPRGVVPLLPDDVPAADPAADGAPGAPRRPLPAHVTLHGGRALVGVRGTDAPGTDRMVPVEVGAGVGGPAGAVAGTAAVLPGAWPRHHAVVGGHVVVALQRSDRVVALPDGPGASVGPDAEVAIPAPACVVPAG